MTIQQNFSLKNHNTFGVNIYASYFAEVQSVEELLETLNYSKTQNLNVLFLGGGSNILFTKNFEGLVIQLNLKGISEEIIDENTVILSANAGENWHEFVQYCLSKNYGGLENLSLIPGNVGTSPMQNIGAYGTEIKDTFVSCKVLNLETLEIELLDNAQCKFGYRTSIFKVEEKGKYIILSVSFLLTREHHILKTEYGAIQTELKSLGISIPTIQDVSKAVINIRQSKLPDWRKLGNAGSFFKNPTILTEHYSTLQDKFPNIPGYPNQEGTKVPAGWLIENCGWKGKEIGNVASHEDQALVIINKTGTATGKEIFDFSTMIIESVREKFKIELEREVNII
ncbi:UDP-N-acetylmuramate dehydrogenase [Frigoriflavimonas asaccharolytica]|uniref:UDP-N-acetylenolpyruvoylglucosamine reductase n=1 Tax=Frigoriflavimonas asaccharolytica TaxID=2735899 RepID=A0A8J8G6L1_9FLAO|nr:UDP-N-acetylmuramate dehydrogenase [Frigoriflavimonas asaccharolytica]NRS91956.1 UDP-N-acetylmuramate dehydrogenase [Frigoriflavimonas asaccharolytica]